MLPYQEVLTESCMQISVPAEVFAVCQILERAGYEAYIVGGSVRDLLLDRTSHDWDFTTNAHPEDIQRLFPDSFYENEFGTVGIPRSHLWAQLGWPAELLSSGDEEVYEVTTFRSEGQYQDFRRPTSVTWGQTLNEDLQRRDFTINAMALRVVDITATELVTPTHALSEWSSIAVELFDPYNGQHDLKQHRIRAVGDADTRFQEDALRMLRAVRLAAQLQFSLDMETVIALQQQADLIQHVSWERIRDEFLKILVTDTVEDALTLLYTTGLLKHILPELITARGIEQRGHHEHDVWLHSLRACQLCPSDDPIVKFAALLHDIAKPETQSPLPESPGEYSFYNHEVIGARTARDVARRFRLSQQDVQRIFTLVRWHMFHYQSDMTDAAIRRFIRRVGKENIHDMMAIREGDRLGSGSKRTSWRLEEMKERIESQLHQPMQINEMAIDGHTVMTELNLPPGPQVGTYLKQLFEEVLDDPSRNTATYLLPRLHEIAKENSAS